VGPELRIGVGAICDVGARVGDLVGAGVTTECIVGPELGDDVHIFMGDGDGASPGPNTGLGVVIPEGNLVGE